VPFGVGDFNQKMKPPVNRDGWERYKSRLREDHPAHKIDFLTAPSPRRKQPSTPSEHPANKSPFSAYFMTQVPQNQIVDPGHEVVIKIPFAMRHFFDLTRPHSARNAAQIGK